MLPEQLNPPMEPPPELPNHPPLKKSVNVNAILVGAAFIGTIIAATILKNTQSFDTRSKAKEPMSATSTRNFIITPSPTPTLAATPMPAQ